MTLRSQEMILVFGIRRSGNHLISDSLIHQCPNPRFQAMNVQLDFFYFLDNFNAKCDLYRYALMGIEEHPVEAIDIAYTKNAENIRKVVILRDPYNLFASRIKHYNLMKAPHFNADFATYNWVAYAQYYQNPSSNVVCISYNQFVSDIFYRRQILSEMDIEFSSRIDQEFMNKVDGSLSGGSSFDGQNFNGNGSQMKVCKRWENYKDNVYFKSLFTDEVKTLAEEIFDFRPF